jgi:hypothetical protein
LRRTWRQRRKDEMLLLWQYSVGLQQGVETLGHLGGRDYRTKALPRTGCICYPWECRKASLTAASRAGPWNGLVKKRALLWPIRGNCFNVSG